MGNEKGRKHTFRVTGSLLGSSATRMEAGAEESVDCLGRLICDPAVGPGLLLLRDPTAE